MAETVSKLVVELDLDDRDFTVGIRGAHRELEKIRRLLQRSNRTVKTHERHVKSLGGSFRNMVVTLGLVREAMRTVWQVTGRAITGVIQTSAEFERLGVLLQGMADGANQIERAADAQDQFNIVMNEAKNAPFTVKELTNSWVKFKSVGLDPADGSMRSLVDAVSAFGGTDDILHRATIAVQQMAGKGVISMEELRQQMGEAVPQAMVLLAKGMNMSVQDMVDAISKGTVEAKPALRKLFNEFELAFGGRSKVLMETFTGSLSRLNTNWQLLLNEMGNKSGLLENSKRIINDLIVLLNEPATRRFAIDIAVAMKNFVVAIEQGVYKVREIWEDHGETIVKAVKAYASLKIGIYAATAATRAYTFATKDLIKLGIVRWLLAMKKALMGVAAGTMAASRAWRVFMMLNPIALLVGAGTALVAWFAIFRDNDDVVPSATADLEKYFDAISPEQFEKAKQELQDLKAEYARRVAGDGDFAKRLKEANDRINELTASQARLRGEGRATVLLDRQIAEWKAKRAQVEAEMTAMNNEIMVRTNRINMAQGAVAKETIRVALVRTEEAWAELTGGILDARRNAEKESDKIYEDDKDNENRLTRRIQIMNDYVYAIHDMYEQQRAGFQRIIDEADKELSKPGIDEDTRKELLAGKKAAEQDMRDFAIVYEKELGKAGKAVGDFVRANAEMDSGKKIETFAQTLATYGQSAAAKLAGIKAQLEGAGKEAEKFRALVESGRFGEKGTWTDEMKEAYEEILGILIETDKAAEDLKNKRAFEGALKQLEGQFAQISEEARHFSEAVDSEQVTVAGNRVRKFSRLVERLRATFVGSDEDVEKFNEAVDKVLATLPNIEVDQEILNVREQINDLDAERYQNARQRFEAEMALLQVQKEEFLAQNAEADNILRLRAAYDELIAKKREAFLNNTPIRRLAREWEDVMGNMEEAGANWIEGFVENLTDGLLEGKLRFKDFAKSVLSELFKIIVRGLIARAILSFLPSTNSGSGFSNLGDYGLGGITGNALGGIMTPKGPMPLKTYARGGIATKPQIAIYGEGAQNEAFVPLPDGRTIPVTMKGSGGGQAPNVEVNVINESGTPVDAEQSGGMRFDGNRYILDVVLKAAQRPGGFRDGMKGAMA